MTPEELLAECDRSEATSAKYGKAEDAMLVLKVPGERPGPNAQIAPGLIGRIVGTNRDPATGKMESMVYVKTSQIRAWLKRRGVE